MSEEANLLFSHCRDKMYVKVYGTIRVFKEEKAIVGTHIKKIDKFDEVTNHLLQVFVAHCIRQKGVLTKNDLRGQATGEGMMSMRGSGMMGNNMGGGFAGHNMGGQAI